MKKILLLEPNYKNKYPPLGLMKIATYHREKGDVVKFAKGQLKPNDHFICDRIYISTLFTFEWEKTKQAISYALSLVNNPTAIYVGGILATLKPDWISQNFPKVNIINGLLNQRGKLGFNDDEKIDTLPPDYTILDQVKDEHEYRANAFFTYTTRGCGMNCSFCAVKKLEPQYIPRISIKEQINTIKEHYGNSHDLRNLLLMDNNVLKSPCLRQIVDEIKELGFAKGARYINPLTKKAVQRYVDFNQGLDANLLTQEKANMLGELELKPVRIAFDHILDENNYVTAITRCVTAGLRHFSNYLLYNTESGPSFKGHHYRPDTPEDLYNRLIININLQEQLNSAIHQEDKITIYSFPMKYAPLDLPHRKFIGSNWNAKYLRAIQVMLTPTQGKGISGRKFFNASFGENIDEFKMFLAMPEHILFARGHFVETKANETPQQYKLRHENWQLKRQFQLEWISLYNQLPEREQFIQTISNNQFDIDIYNTLDNMEHKQIFLYYLTSSRLLDFLQQVTEDEKNNITKFLQENKAISKLLRQYIKEKCPSYKRLAGYMRLGDTKIKDTLKHLIIPSCLKTRKYDWITEIHLPLEKVLYELNLSFEKIYDKMPECEKYIEITNCKNKFKAFSLLQHPLHKKAVILNYTPFQLLEFLSTVDSETDLLFLQNYLTIEAPYWIRYLAHYLYYSHSLSNTRLNTYVNLFGKYGVDELLRLWFEDLCKSNHLLEQLSKTFLTIGINYSDVNTLLALKEYVELDLFTKAELSSLYALVKTNQYDSIRNSLISRFEKFKELSLNQISEDITSNSLKNITEEYLNQFYERFLS